MKKVIIYVSSLRRGGAEKIAIRLATELGKSYTVFLLVNTLDGKNSYTYEKDNLIVMDVEKPSHSIVSGMKNNYMRLLKIKKALVQCEADLIICFGTKQSILAALLKLNMKVKVIAYEQTVLKVQRLGRLWYSLYLVTYVLVDKIVMQTREGYELLPGFYKKKTRVIGNPIEIPNNIKVGVDDKKNTLIAMGRLIKVKDFPYLIEVFNMTKNDHDWNLEIWGQGPEAESLAALISHFELNDRVRLMGVTETPLEVLSRAKIFLLTSEYEGFSNALAEAMSVGLPCISVDCPTGPKDLLSNGVGIIVSRSNKQEFAKAVTALINNQDEQVRLGALSVMKIKTFETGKVVQEWISLINEA